MDQFNTVVSEIHLPNLIEHSTELSSLLKSLRFYYEDISSVINAESIQEVQNIVTLPKKLEICIEDSSKFDEAISLLEFIDVLHKNYGDHITLIEDIYKESSKQRGRLVSNLCDRLEHLKDLDSSSKEITSSNSEAVKIVNSLIKCGNFSDRDLRLRYLEARDNWFNNACEAKSASFDDVVLVYCKGLPMIFQEYRTIFNDTSHLLNWKLIECNGSDNTLTKEDGAIINSWLLLKTSIFIASLDVYLKSFNQNEILTPTMLGDTMSKCYELTEWLSSIGFDFSSQLSPLFYKTLTEEIKSSIDKATSNFESSFIVITSKSIESLLLPIEDDILRISHGTNASEKQLPKSIEHYPVFKIYCLYLIDSLRWIEMTRNSLSPICLCMDTYSALNASLTRAAKALVIMLNIDNNSMHPILSKIALSFITEILPFISNYCEDLFPERVLLNAIGLSKSEFKSLCLNEPDKLKNFRLDIRCIAEPLKSTMPALLSTIETC